MENEKKNSKLKELKVLVDRVVENPTAVAKGIINDAANSLNILDEAKQKEIAKRRDICKNCPYNSDNAKLAGWYQSERPDLHCSLCSCNIDYKTACMECDCGADWYNKNNKINQTLEVKWFAYKPE